MAYNRMRRADPNGTPLAPRWFPGVDPPAKGSPSHSKPEPSWKVISSTISAAFASITMSNPLPLPPVFKRKPTPLEMISTSARVISSLKAWKGKSCWPHELAHVVQQLGGSAIHRKAKKPKCGPSDCGADCAPHQGPVHNPACDNETCAGSGALQCHQLHSPPGCQSIHSNGLRPKSAMRSMRPEWRGPFLSSPNPNKTPTGSHTIGIKCSACHTNQHGNGMGLVHQFCEWP